MPLHKGQKNFLNKIRTDFLEDKNYRIFVLTCANRWGKSVTIACLHCWFDFYKIGLSGDDTETWEKTTYRTANISPHSANTEAVFKTIHQILTSSYTIQDPKTHKLRTNQCQISWWYIPERTINTPPYKQFFANNSYIEHRSLGGDQGDSLQGKPFGLITYDEGSRSDHLEMEMNDAILPRLMDWQGPFCILSTPSQESKSNLYYYKMYKNGLVGLEKTYTQTGKLEDNEFLSKEQIAAQYDLFKDSPLAAQVLGGEFIFGGSTLFSLEAIVDAQDASLNDGILYEEGHRYDIGTDTAIGSDEMVHSVLDTTQKPFRLVRQPAAKGNSKSPQQHQNDFVNLCEAYSNEDRGNIKHALETWNGESVRFYLDLPEWIKLKTKCYGSWQPDRRRSENQNPSKPRTNAIKKADLLLSLSKLLEARELKLPATAQKLLEQLSWYREDDSKLQTDRLMSLALACWLATEGRAFLATDLAFIDM